jgi:hypothetical protein
MLKLPGLTISLLGALAVLASGCGSTETASTGKVASTNAGTSAPAGETPRTTSQSTAPKAAHQTAKVPAGKAPRANPEHQATVPTTSTEAAKPKTEAAKPVQAPLRHRFPREVKNNFIAVCTAAKGSTSSCECIVAKYESMNVEEGQSLAQLVGVWLSLKVHGQFTPQAKLYAKECKNAAIA